jgi:deoxyribonuclease-2
MKILLLLALSYTVTGYPVCKSDNGNAVDIWVAFKGPQGTDYAYFDSQTVLELSPHSMNSTTIGALGSTLSQLWTESSTEYIIWNDSPPGASYYNYSVGHSKGLWAWNIGSGDAIILQHSIPQFPRGPGSSSKYVGLGGNAWTYGQHAACFHTTVSELVRLASIATLTVPGIYDSRVSSQTPSALSALANGAYSSDAVCNSISFQTVQSVNITYFAKSTQWNNELYAACLAPDLQTSLDVESWIRGSATGPACGPQTVLDVQSVAYPGGLVFTEVNDHSKWAVSDNGIFCTSDINRMTTQYARGGGAYCMKTTLANKMKSVITSTDNC